MEDGIHSISHIGLVFITYLFLMTSLFFLISAPVESIMNAFLAGSVGTIWAAPMSLYHANFVLAIKIAFALGIAAPATWFIMKIFSREPAVDRFRRRF